MKKELDLRPPSFKKKGFLGGTKAGPILWLLAAVLIFSTCWGGVCLYQNRLEKEIIVLEREAADLRAAAEPFLAVKETREAVAFRSTLKEKLSSGSFSRAEILRAIFSASSPGPLIEKVQIGTDGVVEIQGTAPGVATASAYSRKLHNLQAVNSAEIANIALSENDGCRFTIVAVIEGSEKEPADHE